MSLLNHSSMQLLFLLPFIYCTLCTTGDDNQVILGCTKSEYPKRHLKYMRNLEFKRCAAAKENCHKLDKTSKSCWGYEEGCDVKKYAFQYSKCQPNPDRRKVDFEKLRETFWNHGGFGYLKRKIDSVETYCKPKKKDGSTLRCAKSSEFCEANNLFIDLSKVKFSEKYNELQHFSSLNKQKTFDKCDEMINDTTFIMKLDMGHNMYHHMTNFLNLYLTQHMLGNFSTVIKIIIWDTSPRDFWDMFPELWAAFTSHPKNMLRNFNGKKICFKRAVFPLLPRLTHGIFYNTPLVKNCQGGGVVRSFSEHVLHRLNIPPYQFNEDVIRITLISRASRGKHHRNILNEDELVAAMKTIPGVEVLVAKFTYKEYPFLEQLKVVQNTDILMGMHGAGLTHMLFQPNWGAVFEIYNTEDINCYKDLARLRLPSNKNQRELWLRAIRRDKIKEELDLSYFTWEKHHLRQRENQVEGKNEKFANYRFNVDEFMRIVNRMVKLVALKRPKKKKN